MKTTRQHILDNALKQFNTKGFVNVRLQHIADAAFVSVGHLAYHFKNKDAIVAALYQEITEQQELLLNEFRVVPLFEDMQRYLQATWQLQSKYLFFYLDRLEVFRAYPQIREKHATHTQWQLLQLKLMLEFNISRGSLQAPAMGNTAELAEYLLAVTDNWRYIKHTQGIVNETEQGFTRAVWAQVAPYFTDMGNREFGQIPVQNTPA
ncbi:MAG: TetR/AcrR family transcriptional regulator [Dinghuibacter sp.]|nr:TetR/AcrR family transcriptional regulator [Dinghuibacter sp.]